MKLYQGLICIAQPSRQLRRYLEYQELCSYWSLHSQMKHLCHERPLGGKFDVCNVPSLDNLTYLIVLRDVHSPFHPCKIARLPSSCIFGVQNPELYSLSSVAILSFSRSSRVLDGRPGLRWLLSSASSSSWRLR